MHASRQGANERTRKYLLIHMPCLRTGKRNRKSMRILLSQRYAYALLRILLRTNRVINKYLWPYLALSGYIWPQKRDLYKFLRVIMYACAYLHVFLRVNVKNGPRIPPQNGPKNDQNWGPGGGSLSPSEKDAILDAFWKGFWVPFWTPKW